MPAKRVIGTWPVPAANRIDNGDTIGFGTIDPPTLAQPKIDDRGPRIPRQRGASHLIASFTPFELTAEGKNLVEWAQGILDNPEQDPAIANDIRWTLAVVRDMRRIDDEQLQADLYEILRNPGPVGTFGDRVAEAVLRYTDRLIAACWGDGTAAR